MVLKINYMVKVIMLISKNKSDLMMLQWNMCHSFKSLGYNWGALGKPISFNKVMHPTQTFTDFFYRHWIQLINKAISDPQTRLSLIGILAFEKVNTEWKGAITPLDAWVTLREEWIRGTTGIGYQEHHAIIIWQYIARNIRKEYVYCFNWSKFGHFQTYCKVEIL